MVEKKQNDAYLVDEYKRHHQENYFTLSLKDRTFVVPYKYAKNAKDEKEAQESFLAALLDFQNQEKQKYKNAGQVPLILDIDGIECVMPMGAESQLAADDLVLSILDKAEQKYYKVIDAHRRLKEKSLVDFSSQALKKYQYRLQDGAQMPEMIAVLNFLQHCGKASLIGTGKVIRGTYKGSKIAYKISVKGAKKVKESEAFQHFKTSATKLMRGMIKKIVMDKNKLPKRYKTWMLALLITVGGGWTLKKTVFDKLTKPEISQDKPKPQIYKPQIPEGEKADTYIDFMGVEHPDKYGNLKRMREIRPQLMAIILAIEGYAEKSFNDKKDGSGTETLGSGTTLLIDENGNERAVKKGEKITPEQDVINNVRYIDKHLLSVLGDNMGRCLTDREIGTIVGAGYCWGTNAVLSSNFLKSVKDNEPLEMQVRKLTGFRTPIGLVKRAALLAQYRCGKWTAKDLLDMPIYYLTDKGYVHCSIYTKDFSFYLPCQKNANGCLVKDAHGNDVPIVCDDGYCHLFYLDKDHKMLNEIIRDAEGKNFKTVKDFMPQDYMRHVMSDPYYWRDVLDNQPKFFKSPVLFDKQKN